MINPIPAQYRLLAGLVLVLALCAASAAGGATVASWKAKADHAGQVEKLNGDIASKDRYIAELNLAIKDQNASIRVAEAKAETAEKLREQAQQHAADLAALSASRMAKIERMIKEAKTVGEVLAKYWEMRQ